MIMLFMVLSGLTLILSHTTAFTSPAGMMPQNTPDTVIVSRITIAGNKITRPGIILRELTFRLYDTLSLADFSRMLVASRQNIFNTRLFNFVSIDTSCVAGERHRVVSISVSERWFIWPIPYLEISDRNFNVWWESRDVRRLTYGVDFTFFNARGRNETLKILTHFGYNQKYGFIYRIPYLNRRQTIGSGFGAAVELNRELPVLTVNNEPFYIRSNSGYLKKLIQGFAEINLRPDFFSTHTMHMGYSWYNFDSAVIAIPGFAIKQQDIQQFVSLAYLYKNDHRDVQYYPLKGYCLEFALNHSVPYRTAYNSYFRTNLRIYRQLFNRWYWASGFTGRLSFEKKQPYYLRTGLGYGRDYVRGYEYYVIDGQHFALLKNNLKFALLPQRVERIGFLRSEKFNTIPLSLYLNVFTDIGFVYHYPDTDPDAADTGNTLQNSLLLGYGLGLDFVTYYDLVIRVEGALNLLGQPGFFLHFIAPI